MAKTTKTAAAVENVTETNAEGEEIVKMVKKNAGVSATAEEIQAVIDGTLSARKVKGTADQESLGQVSEAGKPVGRPLGLTTGLPILLAWSYIFIRNEKAPKAKKLTDAGITAWMKAEFPGRTSTVFDHPAGCRRYYNNGEYSKKTPPTVQSHQYDEKGEIFVRQPKEKKVKEPKAAKAAKGTGDPKLDAASAKVIANAGVKQYLDKNGKPRKMTKAEIAEANAA